jgi:hypothetical protein
MLDDLTWLMWTINVKLFGGLRGEAMIGWQTLYKSALDALLNHSLPTPTLGCKRALHLLNELDRQRRDDTCWRFIGKDLTLLSGTETLPFTATDRYYFVLFCQAEAKWGLEFNNARGDYALHWRAKRWMRTLHEHNRIHDGDQWLQIPESSVVHIVDGNTVDVTIPRDDLSCVRTYA